MKYLQRARRYVLSQPFVWLYHYFGKPDIFMNEFKINDRGTRLKLLLRLMLPMFLVSYPFALLLSLLSFHVDRYLLLKVVIGVLSGFLVGITWDMVMNRPVGILGGMWFSIWLGMWAAISWSLWAAVLLTTFGGVALGCGIVRNINRITIQSIEEKDRYFEDFKERSYKIDNLRTFLDIFYEYIGISLLYLVGGAAPKLEQTSVRKIGHITAICFLVIVLSLIASIVIVSIKDPERLTWPIWWALTMGSLTGVLAGVTLKSTSSRLADWGIGIGSGIVIGSISGISQQAGVSAIALTIAPSIVAAIAWSITALIAYGGVNIAGYTRKTNLLVFSTGMILGITTGFLSGSEWVIILFPLCYLIGYWQPPLWLLNFISMITAASVCGERPEAFEELPVSSDTLDEEEPDPSEGDFSETNSGKREVFTRLRASSIYWDKWEVLPVPDPSGLEIYRPGLEDMMKLAVEQDIEQAKEILMFIEAERPLRFEAAQSGASKGFLKYIFYENKKIQALTDVSELAQQFTRLQVLAVKLKLSNSIQWLILLNSVMEVASKRDVEQAVEIWSLIQTRTSTALVAAEMGLREGLMELITGEMESQKTLRDIAETARKFAELQDLTTGLKAIDLSTVVSDLDELFAHLRNVCLDADRYLNSLGWHARYDALQSMLTNLRSGKKFASNLQVMLTDLKNSEEFTDKLQIKDFRRGKVTQSDELDKLSAAIDRRVNVLDYWSAIAQHELDKLEQEPRKTDQINNPYVVGQALQPGTSLFVGRQDLVQQLEQGLVRGSHRPTFFLNGERRMGKSSTLRQLPFLLDARHFLPIFFDLQAPEMTSSIAAFLGTIAEKMIATVEAAGMRVDPLENRRLQEVQRENEAAVYFIFNEWLKQIECALEQNGCIILLSFDEFENLEVAGRTKYLDLHLLLNWFRSVIQNRPQLALLFSGGKSVSEIGQETGFNWSGYFVNVQTFRVSFLHETDARHLITQPVPDYPIEQIFGPGVVDEIIHVTGCHPFLVQAICSNLVNNLNVDSRNRAEIQDVTVAVTQVLEEWEDSYFHDLWTRSDVEQQACLIALSELGQSDVQHIAQYIYKGKEIKREILRNVRLTLQSLLKRDLVSLNETYQIATPIFNRWVERRVGSNL